MICTPSAIGARNAMGDGESNGCLSDASGAGNRHQALPREVAPRFRQRPCRDRKFA